MTHSRTHHPLSQEKRTKPPKIQYIPRIPLGALVKKQRVIEKNANYEEATDRASLYIGMLRSRQALMHKLVPMAMDYKHVVPSQGWLAGKLHYCLKTAFNGLKDLNQRGIIKKVGNGWNAIDVKKNIFVSKTCSYSLGRRFKEDMDFIAHNDNSYRQNIKKLLEAIPALRKYFQVFYVLSSLFTINNNIKGNINIKDDVVITWKHKNKCERAEFYEKEKFFHTTTLPVCTRGLYLDDTLDVGYKDYEYTDSNIESIKKIRLEQRMIHKKREMEKAYPYKPFKLTKWIKDESVVYNVPESISRLTKMEISIIKLFSRGDIQFVKDKLKVFPENKNSFEWIYDILKSRSNMEAAEIKRLLRENGFYHGHIFSNEHGVEQARSNYAYKPYKPQEAPAQSNDMPNLNVALGEKFRALVGYKACMGYRQRAGLSDSSDEE